LPQPGVRAAGRECRLDDVLGPGWTELARLPDGALTVRRLPDGEPVTVEDPGGVLAGWLGGARGVVVRPDRIVRAVLGGRGTGRRRRRSEDAAGAQDLLDGEVLQPGAARCGGDAGRPEGDRAGEYRHGQVLGLLRGQAAAQPAVHQDQVVLGVAGPAPGAARQRQP
jgi:hypothetical protein